MSWAAVIIGGATLASGAMGSSSSRSAANAQAGAADQATAEQRRQYDLSRQDLAPWRNIGVQALNQMGSLYGFNSQPQQASIAPQGWSPNQIGQQSYGGGLGGRIRGWLDRGDVRMEPDGYSVADLGTNWMGDGGAAAEPGSGPLGGSYTHAPGAGTGMAGFFASPDYNFRRDEGLRGIEQSAAARGGAMSGNALRGLTNYSSNLAAGEYGDYWNRLAAMSGTGQTATNNTAVLGANFANNAGQNAMAAGDARASGIMGGANSWSNAINSGLNNYMLYRGGYFGSPTPTVPTIPPYSR